jgi:nucleotide-binding universal stress UspA family protein
MASPDRHPRIIVGVDGSEASVAALRTARFLAEPLKASLEAWGCWDVPPGYGVYLAVGIEGFEFAARQLLERAVADAYGGELPPRFKARMVRGRAADLLIEASRDASLLVVGRRGHGGPVLGSVSSACISHAHCPVLVVHTPEKDNDGGS